MVGIAIVGTESVGTEIVGTEMVGIESVGIAIPNRIDCAFTKLEIFNSGLSFSVL